MPISKTSYKKNGFLKLEPTITESVSLDIGGSNVVRILDKLEEISTNVANGGTGGSGGIINGNITTNETYAATATVKTGSYSVDIQTNASSSADTSIETIIFLNATNRAIGVYLSSSSEPSYIIDINQTYESIKSNAKLKHTFKYYPDGQATSGSWFRTITKK